ncbi:MAG TPA: co-chaperone GroES [Candidatus Woesebacteria bacterium]|nr:co-chaperone GroES [Candidatus Woesebacteria bacterium]HPJ17427.1 co-chaperone GroES [Candidatus Woesebacteria bacterium]
MSNIQPVSGYLLVEPVKAERTTSSGIVLPESHQEKPQQGKILAVGETYLTDYGTKKESPVKVGDVVIYREWGGKEYKQDGVDLLLLKFDDIMAIVK